MRVIAGKLGGRNFDSPKSFKTHPMSDKIRGALFNTLGDVSGLDILDSFAGSGAIGLEALSRGAANVCFLDNDAQAQRCIERNFKMLSVTNAKLIKAPAASWSDTHGNDLFDIVIADPPFNNLQTVSVQKISRHVVDGGLFVLSWPGDKMAPAFDLLEIVANKKYGDAQLVFYRCDRKV